MKVDRASILSHPFGGEDEAGVRAEGGEHPLGNFVAFVPGAGDFQNGHVG